MKKMIVVFRRTSQRRYAVEAQRVGFPDVVMNPAPGYDSLMPHDMMHFVVEAQLGLTRGIFGQLAAGGSAGTFHVPSKSDESAREVARVRKRVRKRGKKLLKKGRDESAYSERAAYICWCEWRARSSDKKLSQVMTQHAKLVRDIATPADLRVLNQKKLDEICKHLDQLSAQWSSLKVGQSIAVRWPDLDIVTTERLIEV